MSREIPVRVKVPRQSIDASSKQPAETQRNESIELELVSTQALNIMLESQDEIERQAIEEVADMNKPGVLARNPQRGNFEIIDQDELQAILDDNRDLPKIRQPSNITLEPVKQSSADSATELSLVSTMALRQVLGKPEDEEPDVPAEQVLESFDPYNSG